MTPFKEPTIYKFIIDDDECSKPMLFNALGPPLGGFSYLGNSEVSGISLSITVVISPNIIFSLTQ
jgi:hypothetical protein